MGQTVRQGARGPAVREIQTNLSQLGQSTPTDSVFGPGTAAAVKAFQASHGLTADGIVGPATWAALHRRAPQAKAPAPGFDPFDPHDYAIWLKSLGHDIGSVIDETNNRATSALAGLFSPSGSPAHAGPARHAAPTPAAPKPAPAAASTGPIITSSQNKAHKRIAFPGYDGQGYIAQDYAKYEGYEIRLVGKKIIRPFVGGIKNECAQFVQLFGVPRTSQWRRGPQVCLLKPGTLPAGTIVATLRDGVYHNDYSGRSHVGIYLEHSKYDAAKGNTNPGGVFLFDQYNGAPVARRPKIYANKADLDGKVAKHPWTDVTGTVHKRRHNWGADGEEYFVVMTA